MNGLRPTTDTRGDMNTTEEMMYRIRELEENNATLREDNELLQKKAMRYAAYGDVLRTIAMLPLVAKRETDEFYTRIEVALSFYGLDTRGHHGRSICRAFLQSVMPEREKLVRMYDHIFRNRAGEGRQNQEAGCNCLICDGARVSQEILAMEKATREETKNDPEAEMRFSEMDFPVKRAMDNRHLTLQMKKESAEIEQLLRELFEEQELLPETGVLSMLRALFGESVEFRRP